MGPRQVESILGWRPQCSASRRRELYPFASLGDQVSRLRAPEVRSARRTTERPQGCRGRPGCFCAQTQVPRPERGDSAVRAASCRQRVPNCTHKNARKYRGHARGRHTRGRACAGSFARGNAPRDPGELPGLGRASIRAPDQVGDALLRPCDLRLPFPGAGRSPAHGRAPARAPMPSPSRIPRGPKREALLTHVARAANDTAGRTIEP
jgi:hypothetical protein